MEKQETQQGIIYKYRHKIDKWLIEYYIIMIGSIWNLVHNFIFENFVNFKTTNQIHHDMISEQSFADIEWDEPIIFLMIQFLTNQIFLSTFVEQTLRRHTNTL